MSQEAPITPGRQTRVRFDGYDRVLVNNPWGDIKIFDRITQNNSAQAIGCVEVEQVGWRLKPKQQDLSWSHELATSQPDIFKSQADGGHLIVAPGIDSKYAFRVPSELTGVMTGSASGLASQGDYFLYKKVASNQDWQTLSLTADVSSFVGLSTSTAQDWDGTALKMVRLAMTDSPEDGTKPIMYRFVTSGAKRDNPDVISVLYFSGPASFDAAWEGQGQYALVLKGDGTFDLYERCFSHLTGSEDPYEWRKKMENQRYTGKGQVANTHHRIMIFPYTSTSPKASRGGGMTFLVTTGDKANNNTRKTLELFKGSSDGQVIYYDVPYSPLSKFKGDGKVPPTQPTPIRIDMRVDLKAEFQLSYISYIETGYVISSPFIYPSVLRATDTLTVQWFGQFPTGCTIHAQMFDAVTWAQGDPMRTSNIGLSPSASGMLPNGSGGYADFTPYKDPVTKRYSNSYVVRFTLRGVNTTSPTLTQFRMIIDGVHQAQGTTEFEIEYPATVSEVNISGPESDPSHETAKVTINDLGSQYSLLNTRGEFVCRVDTRWQPTTGDPIDWDDEDNDGRQSVLFDGYAVQSPAERKGSHMFLSASSSGLASFPAQDWRQYSGNLVGKWKRLSEVVSTFNWDFAIDPNASVADTPPFAVDVIHDLLSWAGFDAPMIDIGDGTSSTSALYPIRLFPRGQDEGIVLTAGANIADFIQGVARDYLGATLWWDANSTADRTWTSDYTLVRGCWRLIHPKAAPYNILAHFHTDPVAGGGDLTHMLGSYPETNGTAPYTSQKIVHAPIFKDSLNTYVNPPEVNKVVVTGTGELNSSRALVATQLTCFAVNATSYNFLGNNTANDQHPDFVGRERVGYKVDTIGITTPEAAKWVTRRYYDLTAHAVKFVTFTAPLILVQDSTDTVQKRPRPLRFYDPIYINGQLYIIRNVNPFYNKDFCQLAHYECQSVPVAYTTVPS